MLPCGVGFVPPVAMGGRSIGGAGFLYDHVTGAGQHGLRTWTWLKEEGKPGVHVLVDVPGANNVGLLIRTWGKVIQTDAQSFDLDDGSGFDHGDPLVPGVKVVLPPGVTPPNKDDYVVVTGVSSCYRSDNNAFHVVLVRSAGDVQIVQH